MFLIYLWGLFLYVSAQPVCPVVGGFLAQDNMNMKNHAELGLILPEIVNGKYRLTLEVSDVEHAVLSVILHGTPEGASMEGNPSNELIDTRTEYYYNWNDWRVDALGCNASSVDFGNSHWTCERRLATAALPNCENATVLIGEWSRDEFESVFPPNITGTSGSYDVNGNMTVCISLPAETKHGAFQYRCIPVRLRIGVTPFYVNGTYRLVGYSSNLYCDPLSHGIIEATVALPIDYQIERIAETHPFYDPDLTRMDPDAVVCTNDFGDDTMRCLIYGRSSAPISGGFDDGDWLLEADFDEVVNFTGFPMLFKYDFDRCDPQLIKIAEYDAPVKLYYGVNDAPDPIPLSHQTGMVIAPGNRFFFVEVYTGYLESESCVFDDIGEATLTLKTPGQANKVLTPVTQYVIDNEGGNIQLRPWIENDEGIFPGAEEIYLVHSVLFDEGAFSKIVGSQILYERKGVKISCPDRREAPVTTTILGMFMAPFWIDPDAVKVPRCVFCPYLGGILGGLAGVLGVILVVVLIVGVIVVARRKRAATNELYRVASEESESGSSDEASEDVEV